MPSTLETAALLLIVFVGAVLQRVAGIGIGLIAGPVLIRVLGPFNGVLAANLIGTLSSALIICSEWKRIVWKELRVFIGYVMIGVAAGTTLIAISANLVLELMIGILGLAAVITTVLVRDLSHYNLPGLRPVVGMATGFLSSTIGTGSPPVLLYQRYVGWSHHQFVSSAQPIFITTSTLVSFTMVILGIGSGEVTWQWELYILLAVIVLVATVIGGTTTRFIPQRMGRFLALSLAFLGSLIVVFESARSLV